MDGDGRMRICIDLDGVLYEWERTARYMLREMRGCIWLTVPSRDWNSIEDNVTPEDWDWLWSEGVKQGLFRYGHVVTGAVLGLRKLYDQGHELVVVTHRPSSAVGDTMAWLSLLQKPGVLELSGINILSNGEDKTTVLGDVLIDDKDTNLEDWAKAGRKAIQFVRPYNEDMRRSPLIFRAYDWGHIVDLIDDFETGDLP